jgi:crossover junction endodeoxyribonuclease RuvC
VRTAKGASALALRIIGIDPGTRVVGYGVLDVEGRDLRLVACGAVKAPNEQLPGRLKVIFDGLIEVIRTYGPGHAAVEDLYSGRSARSAIVIGEGRGVALLALAQAGLTVDAIPPARVKKALTGNGNATKEQVADMVAKILRLPAPPTPTDASDALAIAMTCAYDKQRPFKKK